jgi:uncharacterized Zn finger protein (UPF0148 family)
MTATCPNCGKPLRTGAKFCGSCGFEITSQKPEESQAQILASNQSSDVCPHCGKSVRQGAKFCNSCGKSIDQKYWEEKSKADVQTEQSAKPELEKEIAKKETVAPPPTPPPPAPGLSQKPKPQRKKILVWFILALLFVLCLLVASVFYIYFQDPLGWFMSITPEALPTSFSTDTPLVLETQEVEITPTLSESPTLAPPTEIEPTETISPTASTVPETGESLVLFEDEFDGTLSAFWRGWGNPRPKISTGPGDNWLDLTASEDYGSGGVTSREYIVIHPGVEIIFRGQLNQSYPQYKVIFDWDPLQYDRGPANQDPGVIHFELLKNKIILSTQLTNSRCEKELDGVLTHTYRFRILEGQGLDLFLDEDDITPVCQIADIGLAPVPGTITFTGLGWITSVKVTEPIVP